ncbi:MAG: GntR family transcriptional regulator [Steroidobacteraceae bacterium]
MSTAKHRKGQKGERRTSGAGGPAMRDIASPRYHQVYVTLRTWVRDGTYRPGDQIPTEPELCRIFDVSRITVRKAIEDLAREGWLVRQQGRGTFVQMSAARPAASLDLNEARSQVADLAAATEVQGLVVTEAEPDEETRAALDLPPGVRVQQATHVRRLRGVPLGLIRTYVPLEIAARISEAEMARQPMFELLGKAGVEVGEADQYIGATLAGVEAARALGVEVGAPLLRVTRVVFDVQRRPVERVIALYRADAYQYRMRLGRPGGRS